MKSVWEAGTMEGRHPGPALEGDIDTDVLIIGGGMAGLLTAYKLKSAGISCVVAEGGTIGGKISGHTTGKITAQHGLIYQDLIRSFGIERARIYYDANIEAAEAYRKLSMLIPCDLEEKTAYVYSTDNIDKINNEIKAYNRLNIPYKFSDRPMIPVNTVGAIGMEKQYQFNPMKFLLGISENIRIYENTFVKELKGNTAVTKKGNIRFKKAVIATHFPILKFRGLYFMKLYQHRSFVVAADGAPDIGGMYVDEKSGGYSFRNYKDMIIIGGAGRRTGKNENGFSVVESFAKRAYPEAEVKYRWAAQDCMSLDGMPYIGVHRMPEADIYVATGFNKWGMTGAMTASFEIAELILSGKSRYDNLFSLNRPMIGSQLFINIVEAVTNIIRPGKRCPHMGCALVYNKYEHIWECPCHGSCFDKHGGVINNPAETGISDREL